MTTTTVTEQTPDDRQLIACLNRCIEIGTDAEKGYALAAADVRDPTLKEQFLARVRERADFVLELQAAVSKLGAVPENEGSFRGALHRGFMSLVRVVEGRDDRLIVEGCIKGEQLAFDGYTSAIRRMQRHPVPPAIRDMVERQYASIKRSLDVLCEGFAV
jgi:uncharacterized protein (TIGR02284 family)